MSDVPERSNGVPEVLHEDILLRLPSKSVIRSRTVCKQFKETIESERFISKYQGKECVLVTPRTGGQEYTVIENSERPERMGVCCPFPGRPEFAALMSVIGSCRGVFCIDGRNMEEMAIWNPAIRSSVIIKTPPVKGAILFGVHPVSFKPVIVNNIGMNETSYLVQMYDWDLRQWGETRGLAPPVAHTRIVGHHQIAVDNLIYFHCYQKVMIPDSNNKLVPDRVTIMSLDMITETFEHIPILCDREPWAIFLTALKGEVVVILNQVRGPRGWFMVTKKTDTGFVPVLKVCTPEVSVKGLLGFQIPRGNIFLAKTESGGFEVVADNGGGHGMYLKLPYWSYTFKESLLLLKDK